MTHQEMNEAIAEYFGYNLIEPPEEDGTRGFRLSPPAGQDQRGYEWRDTPEEAWADAPDYCGDLNAIHQAEDQLPNFRWSEYVSQLRALTQRDCNSEQHYIPGCERSQWISGFCFYHAPAQRRAEAFIRTIEAWKEASL